MNKSLEKLSSERCNHFEIRNTLDVSHIFSDSDSLDEKKVFVSRFQTIPNWIPLFDIDCKKAGEWLMEKHGNTIADCCYVKRYQKRKGIYFDDVYYFLFDDLLVYLNTNQSEAKFLYRKTDSTLVDKVVTERQRFGVASRQTRNGQNFL